MCERVDGMTQTRDPESGKTVVVYVDASIEDLVPEFLENRQEDIKALVEACATSIRIG